MFAFHKIHAIRNLGSSQSCRLVKSINVFEKEKKIVSLFFVKAKTNDEWLQEIKEHERKPETSEKQSDFAGIFTDLKRKSNVQD